jgi:hypothetical protein
MRSRTATIGDLEFVFGKLSQRLVDDYASSGMGTQASRDVLVMNLKEGRAHALVDEEQPVAIIAWHEHDGVVHTLFAAQDSFFTASTVRFCRKNIRRIQALEGNLPVQHRSWIAGPEVEKWFRVIGFVPKEKGPKSTLFDLSPDPSAR